jgi:hypothetical protein
MTGAIRRFHSSLREEGQDGLSRETPLRFHLSETAPEGHEKMDHFTEATRFDGERKTLRVLEGHLFVCGEGCCCGHAESGNPAIPLERFKKEWKERGIRNRIHLTVSGCLGPCAVPNIVMLMYRGETIWFHSINSNHDVVLIYDYVERPHCRKGAS